MKVEEQIFPAIMRQLGISGFVLGQAQILVLDQNRDKSRPLRVVLADDFIQAVDNLQADGERCPIYLYSLPDILKMRECSS